MNLFYYYDFSLECSFPNLAASNVSLYKLRTAHYTKQQFNLHQWPPTAIYPPSARSCLIKSIDGSCSSIFELPNWFQKLREQNISIPHKRSLQKSRVPIGCRSRGCNVFSPTIYTAIQLYFISFLLFSSPLGILHCSSITVQLDSCSWTVSQSSLITVCGYECI